MRALLPAVLVLSLLTLPAPAQQTRAADELAKENRELKEYIERLEKRLGELEKKSDQQPLTLDEMRKRFDELRKRDPQLFNRPAPRSPYAIPAPDPWGRFFFKPPTPAPPTQPPYRLRVAPPAMRPTIPPNSRSYRFNGQDVYIIPLK